MFSRSPVAQKAMKSVSEKTIEQAIRSTVQCADFPPVASALFTPVSFSAASVRRSPPRSRTPSPVPQVRTTRSAPPSLVCSPSVMSLDAPAPTFTSPIDLSLPTMESFEAPLPVPQQNETFEFEAALGGSMPLDGTSFDSFAVVGTDSPVVASVQESTSAVVDPPMPMNLQVDAETLMGSLSVNGDCVGTEVELPAIPLLALAPSNAVAGHLESGATASASLSGSLPDLRAVEAILDSVSKQLPTAVETVVTNSSAPLASSTTGASEPVVVFRNLF